MTDQASLSQNTKHPAKHSISVSVRRLAELLYRRGGLMPVQFGSPDGLEGIRAHQKTVDYLRAQSCWDGFSFYPERSFCMTYEAEYTVLEIRGRADLVLESSDELIVFEIKSFRGSPDHISEQGALVHRSQAMLYGAMLAHEQNLSPKQHLRVILIYTSVDEEIFLEKPFDFTAAELKSFFKESAAEYLERVTNLILWRERRNSSILKASFPYEMVRSGQRDMMRDTLACLRDKDVLFVQAPTGIGKTMAVLYASAKALAASFVKRIFYATAMKSTRMVAEDALNDLRESGCMLRSVTLRAKEQSCLCPELFCDQTLCPYAVQYYDRLPEALPKLFNAEALTPDFIADIGREHQLCPFELSLDASLYCDVIIGDYNHIFDPRIRLQRFFDEEAEFPTALLIDEAHNLPSRSRAMFSAEISTESLVSLCTLWSDEHSLFAGRYTKLRQQTELLLESLKSLRVFFKDPETEGMPELGSNPLVTDSNPSDWILTPDFLGLKPKPDKFVAALGREIFLLRQFFEEERVFEGRQSMLLVFFELLHFHRIAEQYYNKAYLTAGRISTDHVRLFLLCLEASDFITEQYFDKHPAVFFSATLSPYPYYRALLDSRSDKVPPADLILPSPFPRENRRVLVSTEASLIYRDRAESLSVVIDTILKACAVRRGNYLVFCPSFAYLDKLREGLKRRTLPENTDFLLQRRNMSERQKQFFLKRFDEYGEKTFIAFAVLGSLFNEGIDLTGERLSGVIIIGTGLPGLSPEREIMSQYYSERFGDGFLYSYVFPGFNRVQQAAGRLIRSENDTGFILLIDKRWARPPYVMLIPEEWQACFYDSADDIAEDIASFWRDLDGV